MTKRVELIVVLFWLLITIPLIFLSYGSDQDSGILAKTAGDIWKYKEYFKSRTSGFPLYEISISPLVKYGQWYLSNLLSVIFGLFLLLALFYLARKKEFNNPLLVIVSIAFSPIIIKNATSTMDYIVALAFLTWSYTLMRQDKYFISAILIGLASGFRPVSGLFVIPLLIFAWANKKEFYYILKIYFLALFVGTVSYMPALSKYGFPDSAYIPMDRLSMILQGGYQFLAFFGIIASLIIYPLLMYIFYSHRKNLSPFDLFHFSNIILWTGMYIYLPYESEYLLPMLLSVILLLDKYINYKLFLITSFMILSYNFVRFDLLSGTSGERHIKPSIKEGYLISDIKHRVFQNSLRKIATEFKVSQPTMLAFGYDFIPIVNDAWIYDNKLDMYKQRNGQLYILTGAKVCQKIQKFYNSGYNVIVWNDHKSWIMECENLQKHTKLIYNLDSFFDVPVSGKSVTSER